ncbi:hypothetical protein V6R86_08420 [Sphingomonas kaistensis]|uniref:Uncharacterized protein n=1 Tax=Sphingomonas kaistensis TaxID=298708 RepID=A0ABZ2G4G9_9SPHN
MTALLASLGLAPAERKKLEARLAFIGRTGFPAGINAGRGYRGGYTYEQFCQIFMLLHLQRIGLSLGSAIKVVQAHWALACAPIDIAFQNASDQLQLTFYWVFQPDEALPGDESVSNGTFNVYGLGPGESLEEKVALGPHFAAINATAVIAKADTALKTALDPSVRDDLVEAHRLWKGELSASLRKHMKSKSNAA